MTTPHRTIAYLIDDLGFGGAQRQLSILVRSLPASYRGVVIAMSDKTHPFGEVLAASGVRVETLSRHSHRDLRRLRALTSALSAIRPDVIHGFLDAANAYAYLSARMIRRPVVLSLRNERLRLSGLNARVLSWMLRHADRVLVNSRAGRRLLAETIEVSTERILYIPNWIDPNGISSPVGPLPVGAPPVVGTICRFARQKRLDLLIEAFAKVIGDIPEARLVLMGDGDQAAALRGQVKQAGLADSVEFVEPSLEIAGTLARLCCFVIPSAFEGLPNAAIEALSAGIPLVARPVGDMEDLISEGETGTLVHGEGADDLANAIVDTLRNPSLRHRAQIEGPRLVENRFKVMGALDKLIPTYDALIGQKEREHR